jgi:hypothetical protein
MVSPNKAKKGAKMSDDGAIEGSIDGPNAQIVGYISVTFRH